MQCSGDEIERMGMRKMSLSLSLSLSLRLRARATGSRVTAGLFHCTTRLTHSSTATQAVVGDNIEFSRQQDIATSLGFSLAGHTLDYSSSFTPSLLNLEALIFIPHGKTPSNEKLLFQSHKESQNSKLLESSLKDTEEGARVLISQYHTRLKSNPSDFIFLRSPLQRTGETAEVYLNQLCKVMNDTPEVEVDPALLEIDHASWHGKTVSELCGDDKELAMSYRSGSFVAAPHDGESNLDLLFRCSTWLKSIENKYSDKVVCVFGHGTFQNGVETLLCSYGATPPSTVFTRVPGQSHLKRGFPHAVFPPFHGLRSFNSILS